MRKMILGSMSKKLRFSTPKISRIRPWIIRVTPIEAMSSVTGLAPRARKGCVKGAIDAERDDRGDRHGERQHDEAERQKAWMPSAAAMAVSTKATKAPMVIMSPWAKWAKRRMPKISVTPMAPSA